MKGIRNIVNVGMAMIMALMMLALAACGGSENGGQSQESSADASNTVATTAEVKVDPLAKMEPSVTVTTGRVIYDTSWKFEDGKSIDDNFWYDMYRNELGIDVKNEWVVNGGDTGKNKINVSIASGSIPDIFRVDASQLKNLVDADMVEDLTATFEKYASEDIKKLSTQDGGDSMKSATFNGKLYALPEFGSPFNAVELLWVRTDWMEKLNLTAPKTMDDVINMASEFKKNNLGGQDTIGMVATKDLASYMPASLGGFFNGYGAYLDFSVTGFWLDDGSGNLVHGCTQPQVKTALAKLSEMYKEDLIDKEFAVKDMGKAAEIMAAGKVGVAFGPQWCSNWPLNDLKKNDPKSEWQQYPIPSADGIAAKPQVPFATTTYYVLRKGYERPEVLVKLYNFFEYKKLNDQKSLYGNIGETAVEFWKYAAVNTGEAPLKNVEAYRLVAEAVKSGDASKLNQEQKNYYDVIQKYKGGDLTSWGLSKIFGEGGSFAVIDESYIKTGNLLPTKYLAAPTKGMMEKMSTLNQMMQETITKIIMGEAAVDEYDSFIAEWKKNGGDEITKEVNDWYKSSK